MNVTCPECRSMFRVDPSKVPTAGVRARCSICGGIITVGAGTSIDEEFDEAAPAPAPATVTVAEREIEVAPETWRSTETAGNAASGTPSEATSAVVGTQGMDVDQESPPEAFNQEPPAAEHLVFLETAEETTIWAEETISSPEHEEWRVSPREEAPVSTDTGMTAPLESSEDRAPQPPRGQEVAASSEGAVSISEPEHVTESANVNAAPATSEPKPVARPVMGGGLPPTPSSSGSRPMFSRPPLTPPASSMAIPRSAGPVMPPLPAMPPARPPFAGRPSSGTGPLAVRQPNAAGPVAVPPSVPRQQAPTPASSQTPVQSRSSTTPRTPINPFLANDPNAKARRLSRALISDLVTYFPQRRDEGLRNGTLKDLFRDEIKKSFEEYVDQVGRDFANSTTHFQDALNDILAAGKKLF